VKSIFTLSLSCSFFVVGCAHKINLTTLPGNWKVDERALSTGMPNYPLSEEVFAHSQKTQDRAPASTDQELAEALERGDQKPSLRRLYFRALYQQWQDVAQAGQGEAKLKSCPQYHHDKTVMDEAQPSTNLFVVGAKPQAEHLPYYPEWALNVKTENGARPAWTAGGKKHVTRALKSHAFKLRRELNTLCEEGTSDSYFRLENMVTYIASKPEFQQQEGLRALLKIPVFSTMLLVKSVQGGPQVRFSHHEEELLQEVKGFQLQRYIVELKKQRQQLVTGSL